MCTWAIETRVRRRPLVWFNRRYQGGRGLDEVVAVVVVAVSILRQFQGMNGGMKWKTRSGRKGGGYFFFFFFALVVFVVWKLSNWMEDKTEWATQGFYIVFVSFFFSIFYYWLPLHLKELHATALAEKKARGFFQQSKKIPPTHTSLAICPQNWYRTTRKRSMTLKTGLFRGGLRPGIRQTLETQLVLYEVFTYAFTFLFQMLKFRLESIGVDQSPN